MRMPHASASATPRLSANEAAPKENSLHRRANACYQREGGAGRSNCLVGATRPKDPRAVAAAANGAVAVRTKAAQPPRQHLYWGGTSLEMRVKAFT